MLSQINFFNDGDGNSKISKWLTRNPKEYLEYLSFGSENIGVLQIQFVKGRDLIPSDKSGTADVFIRFRADGKDIVDTPVCKKTLTPSWSDVYTIPIKDPLCVISSSVFDRDFGLIDKQSFMGHFQIPLNTLTNGKTIVSWYELRPLKQYKCQVRGAILVKMKFEYNPFSYLLAHFSPAVQDRIINSTELEKPGSKEQLTEPEAAYENFSPSAFSAHIFRIVNVIWPFLEFYWAFWELLEWKNPLTSTTALILWCFLCWNAHLLPLILVFFLILNIFYHQMDQLGHKVAEKKKPKQSKSVRQSWKDLGYTQASIGTTADMLCQIQHMFDWSDRAITKGMLQTLLCVSVAVAFIPFNIILMLAGIYMFISSTRIYLGLYYLITKTNPRFHYGDSMWDVLPKTYEKTERVSTTDD